MQYQRFITLLAWTLFGFVVFATLSPPSSRPELTATEPPIVLLIEHAGAFGLVGFLLFLAYPAYHRELSNFIVVAAIGLEVLQLVVPGRDARLSDLLEKLVGAGGGMLAAVWLLDLLTSRGWTSQYDPDVLELFAGLAGLIILAAALVVAQNV